MATLDDKLMGEKLHYYCSSSEDEDDGAPKFVPESEIEAGARGDGGRMGANTGPKGVIEDWRRFKQLEKENREEQTKERDELVKKLSMTCRSDKEDQEAKAKEEKIDRELEALMDDDLINSFIEKRMREMVMQTSTLTKTFGTVTDLFDTEEFLNAIDKEAKEVLVIIYLYEADVKGCKAMYECLKIIAKDHKGVKFCRICASVAGLSKHFKASGVPALLVYKAGELVNSFVRLTDTLGEDFYASDVESFLTEHGMLTDRDLVPSVIKGPQRHAGDSDSD